MQIASPKEPRPPAHDASRQGLSPTDPLDQTININLTAFFSALVRRSVSLFSRSGNASRYPLRGPHDDRRDDGWVRVSSIGKVSLDRSAQTKALKEMANTKGRRKN